MLVHIGGLGSARLSSLARIPGLDLGLGYERGREGGSLAAVRACKCRVQEVTASWTAQERA